MSFEHEVKPSTNPIQIEPSSITLQSVLASIPSGTPLRAALERANAILVPSKVRDYPTPVFSAQTQHLLEFAKEHPVEGLELEMASTDEDYRELVLHSDTWVLPVLMVAGHIAGDLSL